MQQALVDSLQQHAETIASICSATLTRSTHVVYALGGIVLTLLFCIWYLFSLLTRQKT